MTELSRWIPLALMGALATGCSSRSGCEGDWCGTVVASAATDAEAMFPPSLQGTHSYAIADLIFLRLADLGDDLNTVGDEGFVPMLAQSWERLGPLAIRFSLDPRARWQDGEPVTAEDVVFTYEVYADTLVGSRLSAEIDGIEAVRAVDERTVDFEFSSSFPEQLYQATYHMRILPGHLLDTIPRAELAGHPIHRAPVGSGPYRLTRWVPDQFLELTADSTFFLGRPGLRRIIWQVASDKEASIAQLVVDEADLYEGMRTGTEIGQLAAAPQLRVIDYPSNSYMYLQFNLRDPDDRARPHSLFQDRTLRRALSMVIDRETVRTSVFGDHGSVAVAPVSQVLSIWRADLPRIEFDRDRAIEMLEDLGWRDSDGDGIRDRSGTPLSFELVSSASDNLRHDIAVLIQEQFRQAGVEMIMAELEFNSLIERVPAGRFDMFLGFRGQDPSPTTIRGAWGSVGIGGSNFGSYSNARFDDLMDRAIAEFNPATAGALWQQAMTEIVADAPAIWLFSPVAAIAIHRRVENVTVRPDQWATTMWQWRVPADRMINRDRADN